MLTLLERFSNKDRGQRRPRRPAREQKLNRLIRVLALVLLVPVVTISGVSAQPAPAARRDHVVIGLSQEPNRLMPMWTAMAAAFTVMSTMFTWDTQRDEKWKLFPQGAEYLPNLKDGTWTVSGDKMSLVWKIRRRNWHDGRPVTCADYVFTHNVARNEQVPVVVRNLTNRIANILCTKGASGTDITVSWNERYAFANVTISEYGALPRHILEPYYRRDPANLEATPYGSDPKVTIGDGAYRLVEWRKGASITVEYVADHPIFGRPKIKRITWVIIPDTNALVANMLAGAIDVGVVPFDQLPVFERQAAGRFKVTVAPGLIWEHIDFNLDHPLLQDVRVRRAIAHAIDRELIVQQLFAGKQQVSHSYLPPLHPGYTDTVQKYPYDPARARALLQEAGFTPGPDGVMRNAAGQRLSLEIGTTAGNRLREQVQVIIQQQLHQIGIEVTILNFPARIFFRNIGQRKFTLAMYAWLFDPISDCDQLFTSDGIPTEANRYAGQNFPGYKNGKMDAACEGASREIDEGRRKALLNESTRLFARDLPALPLFFRAEAVAVKSGLQNVAPTGLAGASVVWNVHRWFWE